MSQQANDNLGLGGNEPMGKGRRWVLCISLIVFALVLGLSLVVGWGYRAWVTNPSVPAGIPMEIQVRIPQGMTLTAAADTLVAKKLLNNARVFLLGARITGQDMGLRAGLYALKRGTAPRDLLTDLTIGRSVQVKITIPEGLSVDEIAAIVAETMGFEPDIFLAQADSLARITIINRNFMGSEAAFAVFDSLVIDEKAWGNRQPHWCEGYLAPDTYYFSEGTTALRVADHLISIQTNRLERARKLATGKLGSHLSDHELLTLASIVEAEARRDDERAKISAVYTNRLLRRWRLQADPTIAFFLQKKGERLYFKDLRITSPFNTYENHGLPPAPIAAPGWLSLHAAAVPDSLSKNMFFVSDGFDGHVFTATAQEHEKAVQRFRRFRNGMRH